MARITTILGKKLAARRNLLALTQSELGQRVGGMSDENVGRIERADTAGILTKKLPALAAALGMTLEEVRAELVPPGKEATGDVQPNGFRPSAASLASLRELAYAWGVTPEQAFDQLLAKVIAVDDPERSASSPTRRKASTKGGGANGKKAGPSRGSKPASAAKPERPH